MTFPPALTQINSNLTLTRSPTQMRAILASEGPLRQVIDMARVGVNPDYVNPQPRRGTCVMLCSLAEALGSDADADVPGGAITTPQNRHLSGLKTNHAPTPTTRAGRAGVAQVGQAPRRASPGLSHT